ncbi:BnaAnng23250D [Brassica napus]|uniref:ATP-dependent (S)-NAD(P)H-hydrate dehydratase n=1 Tax=Brassica napus TaxID=3708 RepID=A0A078JME5_BRANA|nr:BnaAnng23250D [Brassica napus]
MLVKHCVISALTRSTSHSPSSTVLRRQQFLVRTLCASRTHLPKLIKAMSSTSEADAESVLRTVTPTLDPKRHKGQAGKIAVIGGCREYTGAPYFAAISALRIGADLSHVFCTKDAAPVIKSYSPELIVHPVLEESYNISLHNLYVLLSGFSEEEKRKVQDKVIGEVDKWMERFDCLVIGPGLGRDPFLLECVSKIMLLAKKFNVPFVVDGDGLFLVTDSIDLVRSYPLAVLTPNVNEYKRLVQKVLNCEVDEGNAGDQLRSLAKQIGGVTILRKGKTDLISNGEIVKSVSVYGSPRRCGGQGDILSGGVFETFSPSESPAILGCIAASGLLRKAAALAFTKHKRSTLTSDIIECLGESLEDICPAS